MDLQFGVHPAGVAMLTSGQAVMVNHSLEQGMVASTKDAIAFALIGSSSNKGLFALMAQKEFSDPKQLKGKRIAVGQIGDAPYNYTVALLGTFGLGVRDVQWIPVGTDVTGRAAALQTNRADATLLTAPTYFRLEEAGYKNLANLADHDVYAATVYLFSRKAIDRQPEAAESIIKAHAEAIKRFYDDKAFAVKTLHRLRQAAGSRRRADLRPLREGQHLRARALRAGRRGQVDRRAAGRSAHRRRHEGVRLPARSSTTASSTRLVKEGFFEKLFGAGVKAEEQSKTRKCQSGNRRKPG